MAAETDALKRPMHPLVLVVVAVWEGQRCS